MSGCSVRMWACLRDEARGGLWMVAVMEEWMGAVKDLVMEEQKGVVLDDLGGMLEMG